MRARLLVLVLALAPATACSDKPKAPDAKAFAAMSAEDKCEATLPRGKKCQGALLALDLERISGDGSSALSAEDNAKLHEEPEDKEAEGMHRLQCNASRTYADAVLACWDRADCQAFAACVVTKQTMARPTSPSPSSPSPSGTAP